MKTFLKTKLKKSDAQTKPCEFGDVNPNPKDFLLKNTSNQYIPKIASCSWIHWKRLLKEEFPMKLNFGINVWMELIIIYLPDANL